MAIAPLPWHGPQIEAVLPHRPPILLVDRVQSIEPDRSIAGERVWGASDAQSLTPDGRAMVPISLLTESMAQLGAILILMKDENRGRLIYFMGIDRVRYRAPVLAGDTVEMHAQVVRLRSRVGILTGQAKVGGRLVADGTMRFALGDPA